MNKTKKNRKSYKKKRFNKKSINFKNNKSRYNKKSKKKYLKGGRTWPEFLTHGFYNPASLTSNIGIVVTNHYRNRTNSTENFYEWFTNKKMKGEVNEEEKYNLTYILSHSEIIEFQQKIIKSYLEDKDTEINTQNSLPIRRKDPNDIQPIDQEICHFIYRILNIIINDMKTVLTENQTNLQILETINKIIKDIFEKVEWVLWFGIGKDELEEILKKSDLIRSVINSYCSMIRFLCIYDINAHRYSFAPHSNNYVVQKFSQMTSSYIPPLFFSTLIPKIIQKVNEKGYNDILTIKSTITSNTPIGATINITKYIIKYIIEIIPAIKHIFNATAKILYKKTEVVKDEYNLDVVNEGSSENFKNLKEIKNFVNGELNVLYADVENAESMCKITQNCNR